MAKLIRLLSKNKISQRELEIPVDTEPDKLELPTDASEYKITARIDRGAFANVYLANCTYNNVSTDTIETGEFAIKVIELETIYENDESQQQTDEHKTELIAEMSDDTVDWSQVQKEVQIMKSLKHINVLNCYASFVVQRELWLVMPYLEGNYGTNIFVVLIFFSSWTSESCGN